jgi:hypothetical protein
MSEPKTFAERLDAAPDGEAFGNVILNMFKNLEEAKDAIERAQDALLEVADEDDDHAGG